MFGARHVIAADQTELARDARVRRACFGESAARGFREHARLRPTAKGTRRSNPSGDVYRARRTGTSYLWLGRCV